MRLVKAQIAHDVGVYRLCFDLLSVRIEEKIDDNGKCWAAIIVRSNGEADLRQEIVSKKIMVLQMPTENRKIT